MQIKADNFRYDRTTRVLTATGNVVLTFEEVVIHSDALVANLETGEVTAEGNVTLEVDGQSVKADVLTYNLNTRFGTLGRAQTTYTGPFVLGRVHLRAQQLEGVLERSASIRQGFVTTCDERDPLVYLTADEVSVFINDRIVGRRASVWVGGRKIFTLPYFLIFLRERRETRLTPVVGYTEAEGWFVKTAYAYSLGGSHYGMLLGDWMERLGVGTGVEHLYQVGGGQGAALIYRLSNRQSGGADLRTIINHSQSFGPNLRAQLYTDHSTRTFAGFAPTRDIFTALDLNYTTPRSTTFLYSTFADSAGFFTNLTSRLLHSHDLGGGLYAEAVVDASRSIQSFGTDDELFPRLTLRYFGAGFSASLLGEMRWDLDGNAFTGDARYTLERLPELTFSIFPFGLGRTGLIGQVEGGFGRFRENTLAPTGPMDAARADTQLTVSGSMPFGGGTLALRALGRGTWYTTGDGRSFFTTRLEYGRDLTPAVEARLGYTGQTVSGRTPFLFDQISGTLSLADLNVFYRTSDLFVRASTLYDFHTRLWGNAIIQGIYLPRSNWTIALAASFNPNLGRLERVEANVDLQLSDDWRLEYIGAFDGFLGKIVHDRISVTRTFCDCLAVSLSYLGLRGELWLEAWLTAIPWGRGRIGIGQRGNLLFDQPFPFFPRP